MHKRLLLGTVGLLFVATAAIAVERQINDGKEWLGRPLRDPEFARIMSVVERGWRTRLEGGLDRNRGQEARFQKELEQFYSGRTPREVAAADARLRGEEPAPAPSAQSILAFDPLAPSRSMDADTSEMSKQKAFVAAGRDNERAGSFRVLDFGVDSMIVREHEIRDDQSARVVVDITYWSLFLFDDGATQSTAKPTGTERHTFELRRENGTWKIVSDTFEIPAGSEP